jgi:hypothetical protein
MDFEINYGTMTQASAPTADEPLFASEDGIMSPLGGEECVFEVRRSGAVHTMTAQVFDALRRCRAFRPLSEHVQRITQAIPGLAGQGDAVRRVLEHLVQRRLLISDDDYLSELKSANGASPAPTRAVFIRACDRPAQLDALVDGLTAYETQHRARRRYVLLDDSTDEASVQAHRATLSRLAATGARTTHVDGARWRTLAQRMSRAAPQAAQALTFAVAREDERGFRRGGGKGYNLAALLGAGARYALLDDDFVLPLHRHPYAQQGLELDGAPDMPVAFPGGLDAALAQGEAVAGDPFAQHEAWCGHTLGAVFTTVPNAAPTRASLRGLEPAALPQLRADTRVLATCNGHRGHSGSAGNDWLFLLDAASRAQLTQDRDSYLRQLASPEVVFGPPRARLLAQGHFTPFLVDASTLLPPTMPSGRSEDLLFGMLCRALVPQSVVWHGNLTMGHRQEGARRREGVAQHAETPGLNQFINDFLGSRLTEIRAERADARCATLAAMLADVAAAPWAVRRDLLDEYLRFRRADLIARLQHAFAAVPEAPIYWQADVRSLITVNGKALTTHQAPRLARWREDLDDRGCAEQLAREIERFAELLQHWPALWRACADQGEALLDSVA